MVALGECVGEREDGSEPLRGAAESVWERATLVSDTEAATGAEAEDAAERESDEDDGKTEIVSAGDVCANAVHGAQ